MFTWTDMAPRCMIIYNYLEYPSGGSELIGDEKSLRRAPLSSRWDFKANNLVVNTIIKGVI
jgi:hypothetical protein